MIKQKTYRSKKYLAWLREQPSVISGQPGEVHHIIGEGMGGMGTKASDLLAFSLTRIEHTALHHDSRQWEARHGPQWKHVALTLERAAREGAL